MKALLMFKLNILTRLILWRQSPVVIGITGSVGKTSTKAAICSVLKTKFRVSGGLKNYNNEIGLPLSVIGCLSPGKNILAWFKIFLKAWRLVIFKSKNYPEILVLEMGVDRPGDMDYLVKMVKPKIAVVTAVGHSHLEFFGSIEKIKKEKQVLVENLPSQGLAVLNCDNKFVCEMKNASKSKVIKYGFSKSADLIVQDLVYNLEKGSYDLSGLNFKLNYKGSIVPFKMDNVISKTAVYAASAAAAVGVYFDFNLIDIASSLKSFSLPAGRMSALKGINDSFIIDDTYNASPESCRIALEIFELLQVGKDSFKYLVLGDMLEIGSNSAEEHRKIGHLAGSSGVDFLLTLGENSLNYIEGIKETGFKDDKIFTFDNSSQVGKFLAEKLKPGDAVLLKASRGIKLEEAILEISPDFQKTF